MYQDTQPI